MSGYIRDPSNLQICQQSEALVQQHWNIVRNWEFSHYVSLWHDDFKSYIKLSLLPKFKKKKMGKTNYFFLNLIVSLLFIFVEGNALSWKMYKSRTARFLLLRQKVIRYITIVIIYSFKVINRLSKPMSIIDKPCLYHLLFNWSFRRTLMNMYHSS